MKVKSKALEINLADYHVDVAIDEKYSILQEVMSKYYGIMEGLNTFLKELSHPYRNWQFIVQEARVYSLDYFHLLKSHPKGPEAARLFVGIFIRAIESKSDIDVRADAVDNFLLFVQKIIKESGADFKRFKPAIDDAFDRIRNYEEEDFFLFVKSFYQMRKLAEALKAGGRDVVLTREPGGSKGAEEIRRLLVEGDPGRWSAETEILLFTAARRDHLERTILPALARGAIVISDRFADSTRVYQGAARGDLREIVDTLHKLMIGHEPDLTLVIDLDAEQGLTRGLARNSGEDRFEELGADFQQKLRRGYHNLLTDFPSRCIGIDGNADEDTVAKRVREALTGRLP